MLKEVSGHQFRPADKQAGDKVSWKSSMCGVGYCSLEDLKWGLIRRKPFYIFQANMPPSSITA